MKKYTLVILLTSLLALTSGCGRSYKAKPLPFKTPTSFNNVIKIGGADIASKAFVDPKETQKAFGFDTGQDSQPVLIV